MSVEALIEKAGTQRALAQALDVTQPVIAHWKKKGWMPVKRALQAQELYGIAWASLVRPELRNVI